MELIATGLSFHTAPLVVRERASVPESQARTLLRFLVGHSGLGEAVVLSTCNRTEFYLTAPAGRASADVPDRLARYLDPGGVHGVATHLVTRTGEDALRHIFRVASGLDSMVLGEHQILGQFKAAHRVAREAGTLDHTLDFVMKRAVSVAKRVRTETGLGRGTGSVGELALRWAREALGGVDGRGVLLVGAGEMSAVVARLLHAAGARLWITSRGGASAAQLADELGGVAVAVDRLDDVAAGVDLVVCSTTAAEPVLRAVDVARFQELRSFRPLCVLDIAVPRDVEPEAARVPGVLLNDLDALGSLADHNLAGRRQRVPAAEALVSAEVGPTMALLEERDATAPTIAALVGRAEEVRRGELERSLARLPHLDAAGREAVDALTRSLVRKLLHAPIAHLKGSADDPAAALHVREAFDLDEPVRRAGRRGGQAGVVAPPEP